MLIFIQFIGYIYVSNINITKQRMQKLLFFPQLFLKIVLEKSLKMLLQNGFICCRPLHEAAENGFTDLMEVLLRFGADPELSTCNGQTAHNLATDQRARSVIEQYRSSLQQPAPPSILPTTTAIRQGLFYSFSFFQLTFLRKLL